MKNSLLLLGVIAALAIGAPAYSQYIYADVNGDGVNTAADALTSSTTAIDVYLDTNHTKAGTVVTCSPNNFDIASYDVILRSSGSGSVAFTSFTNGAGMTGFTVLDAFTVVGTDVGVGYQGPTYLGPGLFKLGTFAVTVTGTPVVGFVGTSTQPSIPSFGTGFGSHCDGTTNPNTITLGIDFIDGDGTASPTPAEATTWGKIKQLYR